MPESLQLVAAYRFQILVTCLKINIRNGQYRVNKKQTRLVLCDVRITESKKGYALEAQNKHAKLFVKSRQDFAKHEERKWLFYGYSA